MPKKRQGIVLFDKFVGQGYTMTQNGNSGDWDITS